MLSSCIYINREQISRRHIVPNGVRFYLNPDYLQEIKQAKVKKLKITLSPYLLADFRYYVLIERHSHIPSDINFSTYYQQNDREITKIKSTISVEGKIAQQICHDDWQDCQLLQEITDAHHWLIEEMMSQLPLEKKNDSQWLSWCIALVLTILVTPLFVLLLEVNNFFELLIIILLFLIFQKLSKNFIIAYLRSWILSQLLFGIFSYRSKERKFGFDLLTLFS
ncbi:MAG: hypothetical protein AB4368_10330 [Xenococcaceae cyanobacterium]